MQTNYNYRTIIAFYLSLLYITVIFKPIIPIVSDALAHTFAEAVHIATVHAVYGENHLQKEISNSQNEKNKSQNTKAEDPGSIHICPADNNTAFYLAFTKNYTATISQRIADILLLNEAPPPKFC